MHQQLLAFCAARTLHPQEAESLAGTADVNDGSGLSVAPLHQLAVGRIDGPFEGLAGEAAAVEHVPAGG